MDSSRHYNLRSSNSGNANYGEGRGGGASSHRQRRQETFKRTSVPRSVEALHAKHVAHDQEIRRRQREQLVLGKRFRHRKLSTDSEENASSNIDTNEIMALAKRLQDSHRNIRLSTLKRLSKLVIEPSEAVQHYITEGDGITQLMTFLTSTDAEEQLQALWCITNIAAGPKLQCQKLNETVPYLISFLRHGNQSIQNQSAWALGNLALEGSATRQLLRKNGIAIPLVDLLGSQNDELVQTACFAITSMLHGNDTRPEQYIQVKLLDHLKRHFTTDQECHILSELCWILTYLTHGNDSDAVNELLLQRGFAPIMVDQLNRLKSEGPLVLPVIRAISNILAGSNECADPFTECPTFFDGLRTCLHSSRPVRKETLWLLSNLTAGMEKHALQVMDANLLDVISKIFAEDDFDIRKEASYTIMNIASRGKEFVNRLPLKQILPGFVDFLRSHDSVMLQMGLAFVQIMLDDYPEVGKTYITRSRCPDALDSATFNQENELHQMAGHLLDEIFEEDESVTPHSLSSTPLTTGMMTHG
ncbi:armadillo-type protein [Syncephalis fuscata]|nr:armadillo-type protein [Syncephalis fuscata]